MRNSAFAQNVEFMQINRPPLSRYLSALWPPPPSAIRPPVHQLSFFYPLPSHETEAVKGAKEKWLRR